MTFIVNDSPFAGKEGEFVTCAILKIVWIKSLFCGLRVEQGDTPDKFVVSGRELHLSVLIETMRREGFEMSIPRPEVVQKEIDGGFKSHTKRL